MQVTQNQHARVMLCSPLRQPTPKLAIYTRLDVMHQSHFFSFSFVPAKQDGLFSSPKIFIQLQHIYKLHNGRPGEDSRLDESIMLSVPTAPRRQTRRLTESSLRREDEEDQDEKVRNLASPYPGLRDRTRGFHGILVLWYLLIVIALVIGPSVSEEAMHPSCSSFSIRRNSSRSMNLL